MKSTSQNFLDIAFDLDTLSGQYDGKDPEAYSFLVARAYEARRIAAVMRAPLGLVPELPKTHKNKRLPKSKPTK